MRHKAVDFNYGERPLALADILTIFNWIENDFFFYLGEW